MTSFTVFFANVNEASVDCKIVPVVYHDQLTQVGEPWELNAFDMKLVTTHFASVQHLSIWHLSIGSIPCHLLIAICH